MTTDPLVEFPHTDLHPPRPAGRDRDGHPIDLEALEGMWEKPQDRIVLFTSLVDSDGVRMAVSTIWLGIDHAFEGDPLVYETAVFDGQGLVQRARHRDEAAAQTGHVEALLQLLAHGALPKTDAERIVTGSLPVIAPRPTTGPIIRPTSLADLKTDTGPLPVSPLVPPDENRLRHRAETGPTETQEGTPDDVRPSTS